MSSFFNGMKPPDSEAGALALQTEMMPPDMGEEEEPMDPTEAQQKAIQEMFANKLQLSEQYQKGIILQNKGR